jgi:hypothetical protein
VGLRTIGIERYAAPDQIHRDVIASRLTGNDAEVVERTGVVWLLRQDLPIELLGFLQPPGAMVPHCQIEGLLDRDLAHLNPIAIIRPRILAASH